MALLLKNLLFTVLVPGTVGVYVPLLIAQGRPLASGPGWMLGVGVLAVGAAAYVSSVWGFATRGRGTPAPIDAPKQLVVQGLYRYTRNPMYVGVLTVILGWAILFPTMVIVGYGLVVASCFQLFIVLYEEPHLEREFGGEYQRYRRTVGRWLPKLRR